MSEMTPSQQQPVAPRNPAPAYRAAAPASQIVGVGEWVLTLFIASIPLVGFIYLLVLAFGSTPSLNKKNMAKALLILQVIAVVLVFILSMSGALTASTLLDLQ